MMANPDGFALQNALIDPQAPLSPLQQALRIALYDEFRAQATYRRVIEVHGEAPPFDHIVQAEGRHIQHLQALFQKYGVPPVVDDWYPRVAVAPSWVENCELGVAGEIGNIMLYDRLLIEVPAEEVRDVFYRLQAASYNHHLPAFRACVAGQGRAQATLGTTTGPHADTHVAAGLPPWAKQLWQQWQDGAFDPKALPAQLPSLLNQLGGPFLWGALTGAGLVWLLNNRRVKEGLGRGKDYVHDKLDQGVATAKAVKSCVAERTGHSAANEAAATKPVDPAASEAATPSASDQATSP